MKLHCVSFASDSPLNIRSVEIKLYSVYSRKAGYGMNGYTILQVISDGLDNV